MNNFEEFDKYVMTTYKRFPVSFEYGDGIYLYDEKCAWLRQQKLYKCHF